MKPDCLWFGLGIAVLVAGALAVRLPRLEQRPMHADEANQAFKTGILLETGVYRYDPHEHHGPSLYWFTLPSLWLSGADRFAVSTAWEYRVVPVVFGVGVIALLALVADGLGRGPALVAGLLAAVSPAMVFYSRYYIQEALLVFFTFAAMACAWRYVCSRSVGWAIGLGASVGLMHATKETWILSAAAAGVALLAILAWRRWGARRGVQGQPTPWEPDRPDGPSKQPTRPHAARELLVAMVAAVVVALLVSGAFYCSFGRHGRGMLDSVLAFGTYLRRGTEPGLHAHPWHYYFQLLLANRPARGFFWTEGLIVGLAGVGIVAAAIRSVRPPSSREPPSASLACLFVGVYTVALSVLYSAVPYKTPWCLLSFFQGMTLMGGVGACAIIRCCARWWTRAAACILLAIGLVHLGWQCYWLNYRLDADPRNPYVYAHTSRDVVNLSLQMERLAQVAPEGHGLVIHVVMPENYWPLPWYLRRFSPDRVGYWHDAHAWSATATHHVPPAVVILTEEVRAEVEKHLQAEYNKQMIFGLRPGVLLSVFVREDIWRAFQSATSSGAKTIQES